MAQKAVLRLKNELVMGVFWAERKCSECCVPFPLRARCTWTWTILNSSTRLCWGYRHMILGCCPAVSQSSVLSTTLPLLAPAASLLMDLDHHTWAPLDLSLLCFTCSLYLYFYKVWRLITLRILYSDTNYLVCPALFQVTKVERMLCGSGTTWWWWCPWVPVYTFLF